MKSMGIQGVIRGKPHRTTIPDKKSPCPLDKVNCQFCVPAPNMLWVSDFTYVAFVIDTKLAKSLAGASAARRMSGSFSMLWNRHCMTAANGAARKP